MTATITTKMIEDEKDKYNALQHYKTLSSCAQEFASLQLDKINTFMAELRLASPE